MCYVPIWQPVEQAAENDPQCRSQSRASLRRTARVRLSRPAPCGLAGRNFEQPLGSPLLSFSLARKKNALVDWSHP